MAEAVVVNTLTDTPRGSLTNQTISPQLSFLTQALKLLV